MVHDAIKRFIVGVIFQQEDLMKGCVHENTFIEFVVEGLLNDEDGVLDLLATEECVHVPYECLEVAQAISIGNNDGDSVPSPTCLRRK